MLKGKRRGDMPHVCDRCGNRDTSFSMSIFNTDWICEKCQDLEAKHPLFQKARKAEAEACRNGDYNYPGIGLPEELR
jgi:hypothetical protein